MRQKLYTALLALLSVLFMSLTANAFSFREDLFSLEIPEGEHTYYYTPKGTNMTGTMLENARKQEVLCLIGSYGDDGTLCYTFKAERREGASPETAEELRTELSETYALGGLEEEEGRTVLSGSVLQNGNYLVKLYLFEDAPSIVFTTTYTPEAESEVEALLDTVQFPDLKMERDPDAVPLPGSDPEEESDTDLSEPALLEPVEGFGLPEELEGTEEKANRFGKIPGFLRETFLKKKKILLTATGIGMGVLFLSVLLFLRLKRKSYQPKHARR